MNQIIDYKKIIDTNKLHEIQTYVDSSHAMNMNTTVHTGGVSTFGIGVLTDNSIKQKMNPISSNEYEVIGNSKYLSYNIWYEYFLESQRHLTEENVLW